MNAAKIASVVMFVLSVVTALIALVTLEPLWLIPTILGLLSTGAFCLSLPRENKFNPNNQQDDSTTP
jgi:hypothetical protein